ncbi:MAG: alanine racemase [Winogradskyella arenosi]
MAELIIHSEKIKDNIKFLNDYFKTHNIEWSLVTKVFSGDDTFIKTILTKDLIENIKSVSDSKLESLKKLKAVYPSLETIYINPPAFTHIDEVIAYADISLNTSVATITALNASAQKKNIIHKIIIMIELGELREGISNDDVEAFYQQVADLSHIEVIGIGSNLGCMFGVEPSYNKLMQLDRSKELVASKCNKNLKFISGGTSITLPLLEADLVPKAINHFRVGEAAFLGICPLEGKKFKGLHKDTFEFYANIIELIEKEILPGGHTAENSHGSAIKPCYNHKTLKSYKAILDFGLLDVDRADLQAEDTFQFVGATSDMVVIDVGDNKTKANTTKYKVGDKIKFRLNYIAVARLLSSKFVQKVYV